MATGKQYTLSLHIKLQGESVTKRALDALSNGLSAVREGAKKAVNWVGALFRSQMQTSASARHLAVASTGMAESAKKASTAVNSSARAANTASASWRGLGSVIGRTGSLIRSGLLLPFRAATAAAGLLKGALLGLAGVAVSAWLQVKGAMAALRPAAEMEQYSIQLEVLTKSVAVASRRLAQLKEYARTTNFSPKEVIEASNLMQAFGLWTEKGMRRLRAAGDAANAFGKSITEVVTAMNYLSSGRSGEAFEALSRIGVTRQALKPLGLEFKKSGELITEPKKAVDIVFAYLERQFGGMTARQSRTWKGAIQQLGGEVYNAFSEGMKKALRPLTGFVTGRLIPAVNAFGKAMSGINWGRVLRGPLQMLGGVLNALRLVGNPSTRATGVEQLKGIVRDVTAVGKAALNGLGGIVRGLLQDGAALLERFVTGGGVQAVFRTLFAGMVSAFRFGAALLRTVMSGFSDRFKSDVLSMLPGKSGDYERRKRSNMTAQTFAELFPAEAARIGADKSLSHWRDSSGNLVPYAANVAQGRQLEAMKSYINNLSGSSRSKWDAAFARNMGWDSGQRQMPSFNMKEILEPIVDASKGIPDRVKSLRLDATTEAIKKASDGVVTAWNVFANRLRRLDMMDAIQERRRALRQNVNKELDKLVRRGWDSKGNPIDTERGLRARKKYSSLLQSARARDVRLYSMLPQGEGVVPQQGRMVARRNTPKTAQYVMPQIADKVQKSGKDAAKDAKQEADNMRRDAADKATIQSAVLLDDIRRTMARLATYLGQDFGMATATPGATN